MFLDRQTIGFMVLSTAFVAAIFKNKCIDLLLKWEQKEKISLV